MILVANRFHIGEGHEEAFVERFRNSMGNVENRRGFVKFELLTPIKGETYVALTYWDSMEDFEAWTESDEFREAHANESPEGMFTEHPQLEVHDIAFQKSSE